MASHVHRNNRLSSGSYRVFHKIRVYAISLRIDIDQHGKCIRKQNGAGGRHESEVRHNYFIAGVDPKSRDGDL